MSEPFRSESHAALERVAHLEEENAELQRRLAERQRPPPAERTLPTWMVALFVAVPMLLLAMGLAFAFFLQSSQLDR